MAAGEARDRGDPQRYQGAAHRRGARPGANFYRQQGESATALAQIDYVLQVEPTNPSAVVSRSFILLGSKQPEQAAAILRRAIELTVEEKKEKPPSVFYLMLAAVENETPPAPDALKRALKALDAGLEIHPLAYELVEAKYLAMLAANDAKGALAFVEAKAKEDPKGPFRRLLVEKCREQKEYDQAELLLSELHQEFPDEANLAAALVQVVSLKAAEAAAQNQPDRRRELNDRVTTLVREFRTRYPNAVSFLHAECDMAARDGDLNRAISLTHEIDKLDKTSTLGPLLRARLFTTQGKLREVAQAYTDAIERERGPQQLELRVQLGQVLLKAGQPDQALRQANLVMDSEKTRGDAILLKARALAESGATPSEKAARRKEAIARLEQAIKANASFNEAYHVLSDIHARQQDRASAIAVLKAGPRGQSRGWHRRRPDHPTVDGPRPGRPAGLGRRPRRSRSDRGRHLPARRERLHDPRNGDRIPQEPVIWTRRSRWPAMPPPSSNSPAAHLNLGDLLLAVAESQSDPTSARETFEQAVGQYDLVLKVMPNSIEAVNNKAWILHSYLKRTPQALELANDLVKRVPTRVLPSEFFDTLGSIQESVGKTGDAEQSYLDGLKKAPENPALNFHIGRLLAADRSRTTQAKAHLGKALAARDQLSPTMAKEADQLVRSLGGGIKAQLDVF